MNPDTKTVDTGAAGPATAQAPDAVFADIAEKIIEQQEVIIGPIAISQASNISELSIDWPQHVVTFNGDPKAAIDNLVEQYKQLFGQIAVQTCKEAASRFLAELPAEQWPSSLK
jgi:hypothetical protein